MSIDPAILRAMAEAGASAEQIVEAYAEMYAAEQDRGPRAVPAFLRRDVFVRDNHTCVYCGTADVPLHCDHVVPYSRGGRTDKANLVAACGPCNLSKGDKLLVDEWNGRANA